MENVTHQELLAKVALMQQESERLRAKLQEKDQMLESMKQLHISSQIKDEASFRGVLPKQDDFLLAKVGLLCGDQNSGVPKQYQTLIENFIKTGDKEMKLGVAKADSDNGDAIKARIDALLLGSKRNMMKIFNGSYVAPEQPVLPYKSMLPPPSVFSSNGEEVIKPKKTSSLTKKLQRLNATTTTQSMVNVPNVQLQQQMNILSQLGANGSTAGQAPPPPAFPTTNGLQISQSNGNLSQTGSILQQALMQEQLNKLQNAMQSPLLQSNFKNGVLSQMMPPPPPRTNSNTSVHFENSKKGDMGSKRSRPNSLQQMTKFPDQIRLRPPASSSTTDESKARPDITVNTRLYSKSGAPSAAPRRWTIEEDNMLRQAVMRHQEKNWKAIANDVPGRNHVQCLQRWRKALDPAVVKGHWTSEEDSKLLKLVAENPRNWGHVAKGIVGRTAKQCRERYHNHLDPSIKKGDWTEKEDQIIIAKQIILGNKWSEISKALPGRTENSVKIRWKSIQRHSSSSSCK